MTAVEIEQSSKLKYPGFWYHFVKLFYRLYYQAAVEPVVTGVASRVTSSWSRYLELVRLYESGEHSLPALIPIIEAAAQAHIRGDLAEALAAAFVYYRKTYSPKLFFDDLLTDFFGDHQRKVFEATTAQFQTHLAETTPTFLPVEQVQLLLFLLQQSLGLLNVGQLWTWRTEAWGAAAKLIDE